MTISLGTNASTPLLEFNNVPFRIARINNAKRTDTIYLCRRNVCNCAAARCNHRLQRLIDVVDCKCDVREPALVRCRQAVLDRKSTRLNSSHSQISYAVFCLKKKKNKKYKNITLHTII